MLDGAPVTGGLIGISDSRLPSGRMQPADAYSATSDPQGLDTTVAAAMAASAAAFSPRVGRMNGRVRPYRMLLALANARLGVWLPNPYLVNPAAVARRAAGRRCRDGRSGSGGARCARARCGSSGRRSAA